MFSFVLKPAMLFYCHNTTKKTTTVDVRYRQTAKFKTNFFQKNPKKKIKNSKSEPFFPLWNPRSKSDPEEP